MSASAGKTQVSRLQVPHLDGLAQAQRLRTVVGEEQLDDVDVEQGVGVRLGGRLRRVSEPLEQLGCDREK